MIKDMCYVLFYLITCIHHMQCAFKNRVFNLFQDLGSINVEYEFCCVTRIWYLVQALYYNNSISI